MSKTETSYELLDHLSEQELKDLAICFMIVFPMVKPVIKLLRKAIKPSHLEIFERGLIHLKKINEILIHNDQHKN